MVSLFAPNDYSTRSAAISRQKKLADALAQIAQQEMPVSTVGGITAPISPYSALVKGLTSFGGSYLAGKAAADEAALKKAAQLEAMEARKTFDQEPDVVLPGGSARLFAPTPAGPGAVPASPELPRYILEDAEAMAAGPQRSDRTLLPFNIAPKEQDVTFGDITMKGEKRSKEERNRLLDEYEMSDNPYLQNLSQRLRAESKGEMFEGSKYGNYRLNPDGTIEEIVPAAKESEAVAPSSLAKLLSERNALITAGAKPDDPMVQAYNAKIQMETTRAPGVSISMPGEQSFGRQLGGSVATTLEQSKNAALAANKSLGTTAQIRNAISSGNVNLGPGASVLQLWQQMTGGDPQRLAATRTTIQGLAQLTLDARAALKGQGQISDKESELLEKAVSSSIDKLTIPELKVILDVADRAAYLNINQHKTNMQKARAIPGSTAIIDFFDVPSPKPLSDLLRQHSGGQ